MPPALAAIGSAAASLAFSAAYAIGIPFATAAYVSTAVYFAAEIGVTAALSFGLNAAFGPKQPPMPSVQSPIKQSLPPRQSGFGRTRLSGPYMLFEAKNGVSSDVIALHDGEIDAYERYFLHDDEVEINGPGGGIWCPADPKKYAYGTDPGDRVFINTTLGLATETAFSRPINDVPPLWSSLARGDGIAALNLTCKQSKQKYQNEDFPNGVPAPSVVARLQKVFDPREGEDQTDPATWEWSANPVICLMAYLTTAPGGMGLSYAQRIAPAVQDWIAAADDCDRATQLLAGGFEPRYACGGVYQHTTDPADIVTALINSFDGFLAQRGDGALTIRPGRYQTPSVTLRDEHIIAYSVQHFQPDEEAINELVPSFTDPGSEYNKADAGAWRDEADITARGMVRSEAMDLPWVQSPSQARRLAKRRMSRNSADLRGSLTTNLYGLNALGERYLNVRLSEIEELNQTVIEIARVRMDLANLAVTFDWVIADPDIDAWNRFSDEQPQNAVEVRPDVGELGAPTIDTVTASYDQSGSSDQGARLRLDITSPIEADLQWKVRWKLSTGSEWTEGDYSDVDDGAAVTLITGFVPAVGTIDVQVAYVTAGGLSPWSDTESIVLNTPTTAFVGGLVNVLTPGPGATITDNGDGTISIGATGSAPAGSGGSGSGFESMLEIDYYYVPSVLTKATGGAMSQSATAGAGNGMTDVRGGVWSVSGGLLVGTCDTVDGSQFKRDHLLFPSGATPSGLEQVIIFDLDPGGPASVFALMRRSGLTTAYFIGANNGTSGTQGGEAQIYAFNGGTLVASDVGSAPNFIAGNRLRVTAQVSGVSPTTITCEVYDLDVGRVIATASLSNSTSALQVASAGGLAVANNVGAAVAQAGKVSQMWVYDPSVVAKPDFAAFVGDSITYGEKTSDAASTGGTITGSNPAGSAMAILGGGWGGVNFGNQAQRLDGVVTDIASRLSALRSGRGQHWAALLEGINDIGQGGSASTVEARIVEVASEIRSAGFLLAVSTILPIGAGCTVYNGFGTTAAGVNAVISTFNIWMRANWETFADAFVDAAADARLSAYSSTYFDADQLHLNSAGSAALGELWAAALVSEAGLTAAGVDGDVQYNSGGVLAGKALPQFGFWSPLTNGMSPGELIFDNNGDVIMIWTET